LGLFMNVQIAIAGRGGQGVLFLTRILSECALDMGLEVIASETHGMAMRGGSVISTLKVGSFRGPLIGSGQADVMLILDPGSYDTFSHLLSPKGVAFLNAPSSHSHPFLDATGLAVRDGSPLMANLVLLGFALSHEKLFCDYPQAEGVTGRISPDRFREANLRALKIGYTSGKKGGPE
jgi:indolepyruvate ferredoxin oxidoreductase beta subunit